MAIVPRTKHQKVISVNSRNLLNCIEALRGFYLQYDIFFFIAIGQILHYWSQTIEPIGITAIQSPATLFLKPAHFDNISRLVSRSDMRNHDGSSITLKGFYVIAVCSFGHTHDHINIVDFSCANHMGDFVPACRAVLHA